MFNKLFVLTEDVAGEEYLGYWENGCPVMKPVHLSAGSVVKVVMESRFGDVGITPDLAATYGYVARVKPELLKPFGN